MASRNRRHQIPPTSDSTPGTGNNQVRNSIARYDMSLPQNWTVAQLRVELNRHNIVYNKTDKKKKTDPAVQRQWSANGAPTW